MSIVEIRLFSLIASRTLPACEPETPRSSVKPTVSDTSVNKVSLNFSISS